MLGGPGGDEAQKLVRSEPVTGNEPAAAALEVVRRMAVRKTAVQNAGLAASAVVAQDAAHAWA